VDWVDIAHDESKNDMNCQCWQSVIFYVIANAHRLIINIFIFYSLILDAEYTVQL